jgi:hypothetical protein
MFISSPSSRYSPTRTQTRRQGDCVDRHTKGDIVRVKVNSLEVSLDATATKRRLLHATFYGLRVGLALPFLLIPLVALLWTCLELNW